MRSLGFLMLVLALGAGTADAQGRGHGHGRDKKAAHGIPPGQLPPDGMCRVWYDGVPPGRQPRATDCRDAERIASRDGNARVIYGSDNDDRRNDRDHDRGTYDNRYPNSFPYPNSYPYPSTSNRGGYGNNDAGYDNGYRDGLEKGREDARGRDSFDPVRHKEYRNADRGFNNRYGTKDQYKLVYRDGFEAGYAEGYRGSGGRRPY